MTWTIRLLKLGAIGVAVYFIGFWALALVAALVLVFVLDGAARSALGD